MKKALEKYMNRDMMSSISTFTGNRFLGTISKSFYVNEFSALFDTIHSHDTQHSDREKIITSIYKRLFFRLLDVAEKKAKGDNLNAHLLKALVNNALISRLNHIKKYLTPDMTVRITALTIAIKTTLYNKCEKEELEYIELLKTLPEYKADAYLAYFPLISKTEIQSIVNDVSHNLKNILPHQAKKIWRLFSSYPNAQTQHSIEQIMAYLGKKEPVDFNQMIYALMIITAESQPILLEKYLASCVSVLKDSRNNHFEFAGKLLFIIAEKEPQLMRKYLNDIVGILINHSENKPGSEAYRTNQEAKFILKNIAITDPSLLSESINTMIDELKNKHSNSFIRRIIQEIFATIAAQDDKLIAKNTANIALTLKDNDFHTQRETLITLKNLAKNDPMLISDHIQSIVKILDPHERPEHSVQTAALNILALVIRKNIERYKEHIQLIVDKLNYTDDNWSFLVQEAAIDALGAIAKEHYELIIIHLEIIISKVKQDHPIVQKAALDILGTLAKKEPALIGNYTDLITRKLVQSGREEVKLAALHVFSVLAETTPHLLNKQIEYVIKESKQFYAPSLQYAARHILETIRKKDAMFLGSHVKNITENLSNSTHPELQKQALERLTVIASTQPTLVTPYIDSIVDKLNDTNPFDVQEAALDALVYLTPCKLNNHMDLIISKLDHSKNEIQRGTLKILGNLLNHPSVIESNLHKIILKLESENFSVQFAAFELLKAVIKKNPEWINPYLKTMKEQLGSQNEISRRSSLHIFAAIAEQNPKLIELYLDAIKNKTSAFKDTRTQNGVLDIFATIAKHTPKRLNQHIDFFKKQLEDNNDTMLVAKKTLQILATLSTYTPELIENDLINAIQKMLSHDDANNRIMTLQIFTVLAEKNPEPICSHLDAIQKKLNDPCLMVCEAARHTLATLAKYHPELISKEIKQNILKNKKFANTFIAFLALNQLEQHQVSLILSH